MTDSEPPSETFMAWSCNWGRWTVQRLVHQQKGGYYATREGQGGTRLTALLRFWINPSLRRNDPTGQS